MFDISPEERNSDPVKRAQKHVKQVKIKRFYKKAEIKNEDNKFSLVLDRKSAKTPKKNALCVQNCALAHLIKEEWNAQGEFIQPHDMPITRLCNVVIDLDQDTISDLKNNILKFLEYDSACFLHTTPQEFVKLQQERMSIIHSWIHKYFGHPIKTTDSLAPPVQDKVLFDKFALKIDSLNPFQLIALYNISSLSASLLIGTYQYENLDNIEIAWGAANIEEDWNNHIWGQDDEAKSKRAERYRDWNASVEVLKCFQ